MKKRSGKRQNFVVICQKWEESERGWGTRPDGYSLHLTDEDRKAFIREYWDRMPDSVPDEYERPDGTPYPCLVDKAIYKKVKQSRNGVRCYGGSVKPLVGGEDDWIPVSNQYGDV